MPKLDKPYLRSCIHATVKQYKNYLASKIKAEKMLEIPATEVKRTRSRRQEEEEVVVVEAAIRNARVQTRRRRKRGVQVRMTLHDFTMVKATRASKLCWVLNPPCPPLRPADRAAVPRATSSQRCIASVSLARVLEQRL